MARPPRCSTEGAAEAGVTTREVTKDFDAYHLALRNAAPEAESTATAQDGLTEATEAGATAAENQAQAIQDSVDAMREQRDAALSAFDAQTRYGMAVQEANAAAKRGKGGIDASTKAGRENREVLSELASAWNNQSDAVKNADGKFRNAKKTFIDTAVAMGVPEQKARDLAAKAD